LDPSLTAVWYQPVLYLNLLIETNRTVDTNSLKLVLPVDWCTVAAAQWVTAGVMLEELPVAFAACLTKSIMSIVY